MKYRVHILEYGDEATRRMYGNFHRLILVTHGGKAYHDNAMRRRLGEGNGEVSRISEVSVHNWCGEVSELGSLKL